MLRLLAKTQKEEKMAKIKNVKRVSFVEEKTRTKEFYVIYIDKKDIDLFNQAKKQSENESILTLIKNLEFLQVNHVIEW